MVVVSFKDHYQMGTEAGNCYKEHLPTGERTSIEEKDGTFEIGVWVPKPCTCSILNNEAAERACPPTARTSIDVRCDDLCQTWPAMRAVSEHQDF